MDNWDSKDLSIEKEPSPTKAAEFKSYSAQVSNANRRTQFTLGTYKGPSRTEAASHFKTHEVLNAATSEIKKPEGKASFSLGNYSNNYVTTASTAFVHQGPYEAKPFIHKPVNNICFGGDKTNMKSVGQSEFNHKQVEKISKEDMGKIKDNHRSSHFVVGNIEPSYQTTNAEFRATSAVNPERFYPDKTPHVFLGSFKHNLTTEKQGSYVKKPFVRTGNEEIGSENRKSHLFMGTVQEPLLPTSVETYQGKQHVENIKYCTKDYSTHVNLGTSNPKWQSSYKQNYSTRGTTPYDKVRPSEKSNIILGTWNEKSGKTTAQDSFQVHKSTHCETDLRENCKNNSFSLGDFSRKFDTSNKSYGDKGGKPSIIDQEVLKKITACHFTYGHFKEVVKSKFQDDYTSNYEIPEKFDLKSNPNKQSHLCFGENQPSWESTYKKTFVSKKKS